jgi:hypothetical protein
MNREKIICFKMEDAEITSISTEKKNNVKAKWLIEMGKCFSLDNAKKMVL